MKRNTTISAFSMVEVALALGLVAFCLLAVFGLLPVGLSAVKASQDEAAAVNLVEQITQSIRKATPQGAPDDYAAHGAYKEDLVWRLGGNDVKVTLEDLSASGFPSDRENDQRLTARIEITPPPDKISAGTAMISVAWPVHAIWNNNDTENPHWENAEGTVQTWVVFLPES